MRHLLFSVFHNESVAVFSIDHGGGSDATAAFAMRSNGRRGVKAVSDLDAGLTSGYLDKAEALLELAIEFAEERHRHD